MELTLDQALQKGIEAHKAGHLQEADRRFTDAFEMRKSIYGEENYYTSLVMIQQGLSTRLLGKYTRFVPALELIKSLIQVK